MSVWKEGLKDVKPGADIDWEEAYYKLCSEMQADLRPLLSALGMFDGARPQSPQQVLREAAAKARELRNHLDELAFLLARDR